MSKRALAAAAALCLALGGCHYDAAPPPTPTPTPAPSAPPAAVRETFALPADPGGSWDPYGGERGANQALLGLVCESLYTLDGSFAAQPLLALEGQPSQGATVWTVKLRREPRFSNGEALTAQVVVGAVNAARGAGSLYARRLAGVRAVEAADEETVVFRLERPNADFPALLDFPIALVAGEEVLGTGPYRVGQGELVARSDWWRGLSLPVASIPLKEVGDAAALAADLSAGTVSLTALDPTAEDAPGYEGSCQSWEYPTSTMLYLGFRCGGGAAGEAELRRAASLALDRGELLRALGGHGWPAALPVHPNAARYDQTLAGTLGGDPAGAEALLDQLGWLRGEDGVRRRNGRVLSLTLLVNDDNAGKVRLAQAAAEQLGQVGLTVEVRALDWEAFQKALAAGTFDLYLAECRLTGDLDPGGLVTQGSGLSYGAAPSEALLQALGEARSTGEWGGFYAQWAQELPQAVLCFKNAVMLTRWGQVRGAAPTQGNLFDQFHNWQIG